MYNGKRIIAVVPARGGSKGLPGKNIKMMNGKPLICWTLDKAKKSNYIDKLYVSTDSEEIADVCKQDGVIVPELRPKELAEDTSSTVDVLLYTLKGFESTGEIFDYLLLLEPTSPLRKDNDIDDIIIKGVDNPDSDGVISVGKVQLEHPSIVKKINDEGYIKPYSDSNVFYYQRQMEDEALFPYGVGYLVNVKRFIETKMIYMDKMLPYFIERWQNYEIDDKYDFECISAIMRMEEFE